MFFCFLKHAQKSRVNKSVSLVILYFLLLSQYSLATINDFNDLLFLKVIIESPQFSLKFKNKMDEASDVVFKPATLTRVGGEITYKFLGIGYTFGTPLKEKEKIERGDTSFEDWRFSFTFRRIYTSLDYQIYKGFYIDNTKDFQSQWSKGDPYIQDPYLILRNFSLNLFYVYKPEEYSLKSAHNQSHRQETSGGSWLSGASFRSVSYSSNSEILPLSIRDQFETLSTLNRARHESIALFGGYGYNWVFNSHFYLSALFNFGLSYDQSFYQMTSSSENSKKSGTKWNIWLGSGYNGEKQTLSFLILSDGYESTHSNLVSETNLLNIRLSYGYRF